MLLVTPTLAQDTSLNPNAAPLFGTATLDPSFLPDPYIVSLYSGGNLDVSTLGLGADCRGFSASAPDYRVVWGGDGSTPLRLFFVGDGDATLTISQPNGTWACNDDFSGENLNPFVEIRNAPAGQYDIWVGSFAAATNVSGYLMITEVDSYPGHIVSPLLGGVVDPLAAQGAGGGAAGLDMSADANFGTVELGPGIVPDPHTVYVVSGGSVDMSTLGLGTDCRGFATAAADYRVVLTGDVSRLRIFFVAQEGGDTTLAVNQADGTWVCNDDFSAENLNPMIELTNAPGGVYEIWVGSFNTGTTVAGTLYITAQDFTPANAPPV
jgi:serine protease Do